MATVYSSSHVLDIFENFNTIALASDRDTAYDALIDRVLMNTHERTSLRNCLIVSNEISVRHSDQTLPNSIELSQRIIHRMTVAEKIDIDETSHAQFDHIQMPLIDLMEDLVEHGLFTKELCQDSGNHSPIKKRIVRQLSLGVQYLPPLSSDALLNAAIVRKLYSL